MTLGKKHLPALDGVRGLAILLVLIYHQTVLSPGCRLDAAFGRVARFGWCGVDLFFVLSGFLITGILLESREEPRYFRNFYARRILRIFPLYYAVLAFAFIVLPRISLGLPSDPAALGARKAFYWLYLGNYLMAVDGRFPNEILSVTWSLSIEEQFYLVWPLVVFLLSRKAISRLCMAIIAVMFLLRLVLVLAGYGPIPIYVLTPLRQDGLAVGALLATILGGETALPPAFDSTVRRMAFLSGALSILIWALPDDYQWFSPQMQEFGYSSLALFFGALLVLAMRSKDRSPIARLFNSRALRFLGKYSYALYLFHYPIKAWVRSRVWQGGPFPSLFGSRLPAQLLFYVEASAPAIALAVLSWHLYEKRFLSLKKFFGGPPTPQSSRAAPAPS